MFQSFWQAGFESACHRNTAGVRLDLAALTQHDTQVAADYRLVSARGLRTLRDGVRWPLIDRGNGSYDLSWFLPQLGAAVSASVQVIWTLCHYGFPDDLDVFSAAFVDRFARYCRVIARAVREASDEVPFYTPVNEISFFSWAAGEEGRLVHPMVTHRGEELKRNLVRATITGIDAIRDVDPRARFVIVDPVIEVVPPRGRPDLVAAAAAQTATQFEAWDMLAGLREPRLGGGPAYLDVVGVNYYHSNQWEYLDGRLRWEDEPRDDRWIPLRLLLARVYERYRRPTIVGETSHFGVGRGRWIREIGEEVAGALRMGVPLEGVCLYPIIDRPDWEDGHWHNSGLWDLQRGGDGRLVRVLNEEYDLRLKEAEAIVAGARECSPLGSRPWGQVAKRHFLGT